MANEAQLQEFLGTVRKEIKDGIATGVDERLREIAEHNAEGDVGKLVAALNSTPGESVKDRKYRLARKLLAVAAAKYNNTSPYDWAKFRWGQPIADTLTRGHDTEVAKSMHLTPQDMQALQVGTDTVTGGGAAVQPMFGPDIIEYLRPKAVVYDLNPVVLQMPFGTLTLAKMTGGSSMTWIGENQAAPATKPTWGTEQASAKKGAALIPISNDFIRRAVQGAEEMIIQDLEACVGAGKDLVFIQGIGTKFTPKGLLYWAGTTFEANASFTVANAAADTWKPWELMEAAYVPMIRPGVLMSPRTKKALITCPSSLGTFPFRQEMLTGTLNGYPYRSTGQIPSNIDTPTHEYSYVISADFSQVVITEGLLMQVDTSTEAMWVDANNTASSAFQNDQTLVRVILETDLICRHAQGVVAMDEVTWDTGTV